MESLDAIKLHGIENFVGNRSTVKAVQEFLSSKVPIPRNIMCVLGPDGCGKSSLCQSLLDKCKKQVLELGKDSLNGSDLQTVLKNFANNMTIESYMNKKDKVVFIDDLDILTNIDKLILSKILSANKLLKSKGIKVLMTCNINDERKVNDNAKEIDSCKLGYPYVKDAYVYIMTALDSCKIEYDPEKLLVVVQKCKGNIRDAAVNMYSTDEDLRLKAQEAAFKDLNNFELTKRILQKKYTMLELESFLRGDPGVVPFMLYENIADELDTNGKFKKGKGNATLIDLYSNMNDMYVQASAFEDKAYNALDWQFLSYANILKMYSVHLTLSQVESKAAIKDVKYRFSQLLSKISHKNIMAKKVKGLSFHANVSSSFMITATDTHAQKQQQSPEGGAAPEVPQKKTKSATSKKVTITQGKQACENSEPEKKRSNVKLSEQKAALSQEETSVMNTYEKYFA